MLLQPRYDGPPILEIEGKPADVSEPVVRQRRRMEAVLAGFGPREWAHASRCDGWTVQDVVAHLVGVNAFWSASVAAGLAGSPTRLLAGFDPAATPPLMVGPMRSLTPAEVLDQFVASNTSFLDALASLDDAGWAMLAELPPGHLPVRLLALHALWDAWVHERDILLPLGLVPEHHDDEVLACLRYGAGVGPALERRESSRIGALVIEATDPDAHVVVEVGDRVVVHGGEAPAGAARLAGRAEELVDAFSVRAPLGQDLDDDDRWLVAGLATVFDQV